MTHPKKQNKLYFTKNFTKNLWGTKFRFLRFEICSAVNHDKQKNSQEWLIDTATNIIDDTHKINYTTTKKRYEITISPTYD